MQYIVTYLHSLEGMFIFRNNKIIYKIGAITQYNLTLQEFYEKYNNCYIYNVLDFTIRLFDKKLMKTIVKNNYANIYKIMFTQIEVCKTYNRKKLMLDIVEFN